MGNRHKPLQSNETSLMIQAAIEGLTLEQLLTRDEFIRIGFSHEQATSFVQERLSQSERNFHHLQETMRKLGWADDQVEERTQNFLKMINTTVDHNFSRKENP